MKNKKLGILLCSLILVFSIFSVMTIKVMSMPSKINVSYDDIGLNSFKETSLKSNFIYKVNSRGEISRNRIPQRYDKVDVSVNLFGLIPIKKMTINLVPEIKVIPGGDPIGVKLNVDGVFVVGFSDVDTHSGRKQSPSIIGGIEIGDCILEVNGEKLETSRQLSKIVNKSKGKKLDIKIKRKGEVLDLNLKPVQAKLNDEYKIGLWVRDSTAGVGTLTFYDPVSGKFGALGHPINDIDTGTLLPIRDGKIFNAKIISVEHGERGKPGELKGMFSDEDEIGNLQRNTPQGIYGKMRDSYQKSNDFNKPLPAARQAEVKEGPAKILAAVNGAEVKPYSIYIEKLTQQSKPNSKSMIIRVTDPELLSKTGGIVQGMSGSPIIQNGKIVGAVTHVFVNRPDMGYGIYIEWMLKETGIEF